MRFMMSYVIYPYRETETETERERMGRGGEDRVVTVYIGGRRFGSW